ncbi:Hypothetical protein A7982_00721 [Minicystis rosea]|nr:Hypothetical protein A7982_00721 [Minicystis rosea]
MISVGLTLQPDDAFLDLLGAVIRDEAEHFEVAPETLWRLDGGGVLQENGFFRRFAALRAETKKPFVAHGVGFSVGTAARADGARKRRWIERLKRDHAELGYLWYTDHLGASSLAGQAVTLPIALPMTAHAASVVRRSLRAMAEVVPDVGLENTVAYFMLGDPLEEPDFLRRVLSGPRTHLLLDVHNVYTMAQNFGFDAAAYMARLDLDRVIEIHLSGGAESDPAWLPSGRVLRLDAHDSAVPEPVWKLFEDVAPRCPNLRAVTVERMEGTVGPEDVTVIRDELRRARQMLRRCA